MAKIKYTIRNHEVVLTTLTSPDSGIAKMAKFSPTEGDYMPIFIDLYPRTRKLFWAYRHQENSPSTPNSITYEASKITVHDLPGWFDNYIYIDKNQYDVIHYIVVSEGEMRNSIKALFPDRVKDPEPAKPLSQNMPENCYMRDCDRLKIATQITAAFCANRENAKYFCPDEDLVREALYIADTLIKEANK